MEFSKRAMFYHKMGTATGIILGLASLDIILGYLSHHNNIIIVA
jgi:hypothetical protein